MCLQRCPDNWEHPRVSGVCYTLNKTLSVLLTTVVSVMTMMIRSDEVEDNIDGDVVLHLRLRNVPATDSTKQPTSM